MNIRRSRDWITFRLDVIPSCTVLGVFKAWVALRHVGAYLVRLVGHLVTRIRLSPAVQHTQTRRTAGMTIQTKRGQDGTCGAARLQLNETHGACVGGWVGGSVGGVGRSGACMPLRGDAFDARPVIASHCCARLIFLVSGGQRHCRCSM